MSVCSLPTLRVWREKQAREAASPQPPRALPLIVTTNTLMEAAMEDEMLTEESCGGAGGGAASSSGGEGGGGGAGGGGGGGWTVGAAVAANPFVSLEMLQSGTLGEGEGRGGRDCSRAREGRRTPEGVSGLGMPCSHMLPSFHRSTSVTSHYADYGNNFCMASQETMCTERTHGLLATSWSVLVLVALRLLPREPSGLGGPPSQGGA